MSGVEVLGAPALVCLADSHELALKSTRALMIVEDLVKPASHRQPYQRCRRLQRKLS